MSFFICRHIFAFRCTLHSSFKVAPGCEGGESIYVAGKEPYDSLLRVASLVF